MKFRDSTHRKLSSNEGSLALAILGIACGAVTGLTVNLFRFVLESPFPLLGISDDHDDFESLPILVHFLLPIAGCALLALIFHFIPENRRKVGVVHVIDKVQNLKGHLPVANTALQFFSAAIALLSGQSCGREGPGIHIGATNGSIIGQFLHLPNNASRTLIACGSAAAIAAAFNTPIAGVIFTMEVIMMEYTISSFLPVIMAAVAGAVATQILYGGGPVTIQNVGGMNSLAELPFIIFTGMVIGTLSGMFVRIQKYCMTFHSVDIKKRFMLAGLLTGALAPFIPEIMGTGYDSLNAALAGELVWTFLLALLSAKLIITGIVLGLGIPGGVIGPSLVLGGIAGGILGIVGDAALSSYDAEPSFYVLLGMCAMMAAVLQAPLAALMALLELTGNPGLILPAMLAIAVACLTSSEGFSLPSIYQVTLHQQGIKTPQTLSRLLNRYGISSIMQTDIRVLELDKVPEILPSIDAEELSQLILHHGGEARLASRAQLIEFRQREDVSAHLQTLYDAAAPMSAISLHATLQEAMAVMQENNHQNGYVFSPLSMGRNNILGLVTVDAIIAFYKDR